MSVESMSHQIEITLPHLLYQRLLREAQYRAQDVSTVVRIALEEYAQRFDITQTRTWQLCGAFTVAEPDPEYVVGSDETGAPVTNFAEHVDGLGIHCVP